MSPTRNVQKNYPQDFHRSQKLQKPQLRGMGFTADLRERDAEDSEYAAIAAVSEVQYALKDCIVCRIWRSCRHKTRCLAEKCRLWRRWRRSCRPDFMAAVTVGACKIMLLLLLLQLRIGGSVSLQRLVIVKVRWERGRKALRHYIIPVDSVFDIGGKWATFWKNIL